MMDQLDRLDQLDDEALDALPFGVVGLDAALQVVRFNRTESERSGMQRWRVLGRSYFGDVAPGASDRALAPRVRGFLAGREPTGALEHTFERRTGNQRARIELRRAGDRGVYLCIHRI